MQGLHFVLMFTALTFLSWGAYGPLLRYGTTAMGHDGLKAFVGVGLAYFVIAVIVPFWILSKVGEKGKWTMVGTTYSIIAGSVGAIGALGIILALVFKGNPVYVMPLVFGFAPIVNTLVTAWMGGTLHNIRPIFIGGIIAAALGAGGVLVFKPSPQAAAKPPAVVEKEPSSDITQPDKPQSKETPKSSTDPKTNEPNATDKPLALKPDEASRTVANTAEPNKTAAKSPERVKQDVTSSLKTASLQTALMPDSSEAPAPEPKTESQPVAAVAAASPLATLAMPDPAPAPAPEPQVKADPAPSTDTKSTDVKPASASTAAMPDSVDAPAPESKPKPVAAQADTAQPPPVVDPTPASLEAKLPEKPAVTEKPVGEKPVTEKPVGDKPEQPRAELPEDQPAPAPVRPALPPLALRSMPTRGYLTMQRNTGSDRSNIEFEDAAETSQPPHADEHESAAHEADAHAAAAESKPNFLMIALSIAMAALCWGSYGPMFHKGQMKMGGSRLRPFACVGIAYFIIAVAAPLILLYTTPSISHGSWTGLGLFWSIIAGGAGALGALGIILAFNSGGKPIYVMPLVFGFAPVINTFISLTEANAWSRVQPMFWVSLGVVIAGAITVLITAPKAQHGPAHAAPATPR